MYLKSLEIQGFKSFPDKISLNFDKGLTAVVGPNGSGKSNIGDSVRWVLGEQSTKTLRGNKMEDVIFSGTVARKPMGFAAVTLNIDNTDNTLDGYGEEVAVTRKLYRSGESEYRINGRSCRLKDINELFMDTGLGRDGYSIIGQGRIAEIVGAKSNERRDIFEEAAGISKFRYKKLEAERRLTAAQENLVRLNDIVSELESRIEPLRIQSEKAQKFIKLAEERKRLEISVWITHLDELKQKLDRLDEQILANRGEYENTENDISREEERLQQSYRKMQECTMKSDELRRRMIEEEQLSSQKRSDIAVYENDIQHCTEAVRTAKKNIEESEENKRDLQFCIKEIEKKIEKLQKKREELQSGISETSDKSEKAEEQNRILGEEAGRITDEINRLHIRQSELGFAAESARKTAADAENRLRELIEGSSDVENTIAEYSRKAAENTAQLEQNKKTAGELENKLKDIEQLYSSSRSSFEQAKEEFERSLYELKNVQQRRKILVELENSMEGFAGSVKQILKAAKQGRLTGIYGTVAQNISVEPKFALAIETALGGAVQNIIVENEDCAKRGIRFLKEQKGGRATFLPVTSVRGYELRENGLENCAGFVSVASHIAGYDQKFTGIVTSLLGRTVIAENIDSATLIAKKYGYKFRIVTLDGQVINAGGSFTGGSAQRSAGIITRKNEIESIDKEAERLASLRDNLNRQMEKFRAESEKFRFDRDSTRSKLAELESDGIRLSAELKSIDALISQLRARTENTERQQSEYEAEIAAAHKAESEAVEEAGKIAVKIEAAGKNLAEYQNRREKLRLERGELSEKLSKLKIHDTELAKDIQSHEAEIIRIDEELESAGNSRRHFEDEINRQNSIIAEKNAEIQRLRNELENIKNGSENYSSEIQRLQQVHTEQNRIVNEIQKGIREFTAAKERLSGEITRLEERRNSAARDSDSIVKQLMDVYELTVSEAAETAEKIDDISAAQTQLAAVKNKIRALGSVNVDAVEEYREVSGRYEFLSEQTADILKSKQELEKLISGLTDEMCRIFAESFAIINSNFKEIFKELFGGGKAELILTDPENVLESGIEISVAPPGKVIKNLISLSGGEQSFVAIAIYFAILRLRPAPFCILDEIDAALDEVNVRKYAQYLKKFTDTTQFVLVTHRRSAMEEANVLYGVTMQEDGISKLLKMEQVDFQDDNYN